jgi:hypothetical protein
MFRSLASCISIAVAATTLYSGAANADNYCDWLLQNACTSTAASECYYSGSPINGGDGGSCDSALVMLITKSEYGSAPANPILKCALAGNRYDCEAWPQGDELTYSWYGDDNSAIVSEVISPFRSFSCNAGVVSVAIVGPGGGSSIASATLPACQ